MRKATVSGACGLALLACAYAACAATTTGATPIPANKALAPLSATPLASAIPAATVAATGASGVAAAPACQPKTLNESAALAGGRVTVSPAPDDMVAAPSTQISFLGPPANEIPYVEVTGSSSGVHSGSLLPYSQGDGASFVPREPFVPGETVTVKAQLHTSSGDVGFGWRFLVQREATKHAPSTHRRAPEAGGAVQRFHSAPQLRPPVVSVTKHASSPAPGYLFMAPEQPPVQSGPMIFDDAGKLVWFAPEGAGEQAVNLRVQRYEGNPVLTYWEHVDLPGVGFISRDDILNEHYDTIAQVRAGNGLGTDTHALQLTPQGTALLTATQAAACDLAPVGGPSNGAVLTGVVQQIDVKTGLVMWQWCALDHIPLASAEVSAKPTTAAHPFDPYHLNSIDVEPGGALLISSRNMWAVYDVQPSDGKIVWRFGGKHSAFAIGEDASFAFQHDARALPDDEISVFDNGGAPPVQPQSQALVSRLNFASRTATVVRRFTHSPPLQSGSQGDVQQLSDGRYVVGWGQEPYVSEYDASGKLLFDAHLPPGEQSYRALRFRWDGTPSYPPAAVHGPSARGHVTVWASWNGATRVRAWRVLEGPSTALRPVSEHPRDGFETALGAPAPAAGEQVEVQALGAHGRVLASAPCAATP